MTRLMLWGFPAGNGDARDADTVVVKEAQGTG